MELLNPTLPGVLQLKPRSALEEVSPGDTVVVAPGAAEPLPLTAALMEDRHRCRPLRVLLGLSLSGVFDASQTDAVRFSALGLFGRNADLLGASGVEVLPLHYGEVPALVEAGPFAGGVLMVQLSPPDSEGLCSAGIASEYIGDAARGASMIVAEINDRVPLVAGAAAIPFDNLAASHRSSRDPLGVRPRRPSQRGRAAARHLAAAIPDGACLQVGLGGMLDDVLAGLASKRRLRVHSGLITDSLRDLVRAGAIPTSRGSEEIVGTALLGSGELYRWAAEQSRLRLRPVSHTHSAQVMAEIDAFFSINAALEVDLFGQVNAEVLDGRYIGGVGGAPAFSHAARASREGGAVFVLPASGSDGASRIVDRLPGGLATTPAADVSIVVTEWGLADLRGASIAERARRLVAVAAPEKRAPLAERAAELCW